MTDEKIIEILFSKFKKNQLLKKSRYKVLILLGCLGDLDSFEYIQNLTEINSDSSKYNFDCFIFAIGDNLSKDRFCNFTHLDPAKLDLLNDSEFHKQLKLSRGLNLPVPPLINLILMCLGISSPGTLKEVIRGYVGDKKSSQIFCSKDVIDLPFLPKFSGSAFTKAGGSGFQRPFELATRRLLNMVEILTHWSTYFPYSKFMTERGGTFILDENNNVIYCFRSQGLLGYSSKMSYPLWFLREFIS